MRFMMFMIPKVYQPDTPQAERAGEEFAPPAESVARMMKFNEEYDRDPPGVRCVGLPARSTESCKQPEGEGTGGEAPVTPKQRE